MSKREIKLGALSLLLGVLGSIVGTTWYFAYDYSRINAKFEHYDKVEQATENKIIEITKILIDLKEECGRSHKKEF